MKRIIQLSLLLLFSLTLIQCTSDNNPTDTSLTVNGTAFKLGTNSSAKNYNIVKSESDTGIWLNITEKTGGTGARVISIYASHDAGSHTGTYELRNDFLGPGVAVVSVRDSEGNEIAGGSMEDPTGTVTITDFGNKKLKIAFNDVVLDPGMAGETSISGDCLKTFKAIN